MNEQELIQYTKMSPGMVREIQRALEQKINIAKYINSGYSDGQLKAIRHALRDGVNVDSYVNPDMGEQTIHEIGQAQRLNLDLNIYLDEEIEWRQLREIRLGLEQRLPVEKYCSSLYSWKQMKEIRLGLEEGLDVEEYSSLIHTENEMHTIRLRQIKRLKQLEQGTEPGFFAYDTYSVMISEDRMNAYIVPSGARIRETKEQLLKSLRLSGVTSGILEEEIEEYLKGDEWELPHLVATGVQPEEGEDGYYEYLFDTDVEYKPLELEDGSVDYQHTKWFEEVQKDQLIATYYPAKEGTAGLTVTGVTVPGKKGREMKGLKGSGFYVNTTQTKYYAAESGKIEFQNEILHIIPVMVLDEVTAVSGAVKFEGVVHVLGDVLSGAEVSAGKDLFIDGGVEGAVVQAGGDITIRRGCNAAGHGLIQAGGDVRGKFFERANVKAEGNVFANSILNSSISAGECVKVSGQKGNLSGGQTTAGYYISVQDLGNQSEVPTLAEINGAWKILLEIQKEKKEGTEIQKTISDLETIRYGIEKKGNRLTWDDKTKNLMIKVEKALLMKRLEFKETERKIKILEYQKKTKVKSCIEVRGQLYQGVTASIGESKWKSTEYLRCVIRERNQRIVVEAL